MLLIHPLIQLAATLVAFYVFLTGLQRYRMLHLGKKTTFPWRRHVLMGAGVILIWFGGLIGGVLMVKQYWYAYFITGVHGKIGLLMLPFMAFGMVSGLYMNRVRKKRKILPRLHALNNTILLLLAVSQVFSGWHVYRVFVLGGA